ncbi:MAG: ABC transporter ATP-binding protein [Lachnospiraceae bacterium]|jgi:sulfonate transport system ATP-binding protein|nr:ABC transporter ATP-binding protein [Lachnospiraceae bacterium]
MVGELTMVDVGKQYRTPDGQVVDALQGIALKIKAGAFISLIGPSGCGKSTMLRLIAGLEKPTAGELLLDGEKITVPDCERGFVFQEHTLFPWLNIYDNIAFGLRVRKAYKEKKDDIKEFIKTMGLEGFEKSYPHQLSGGMCQRASLARALVGHPKVLLLDEPLGALDAFTRMNMQDELQRCWEEHNMTMIMVTHDVDEAVYLSDQVIVMSPRPGKVEKIMDIELGKQRARSNPEFLKYRAKILNLLNFGGSVKEPNYYL